MKLRYFLIVPAWLLVKIPSFDCSRAINEQYRRMTLATYGSIASKSAYIASTILWVVLFRVVQLLVS